MTKAEGKHSPTQFLHILWAIQEKKQSGQLHIESGSFQKTIYFLDGNAIFYDSNLPDDELENSLKRHSIVPALQLDWLISKMSKGDSLEEELLRSGILSPQQLQEHQRETMQEGIGQCLSWEKGTWHFISHPWLKEAISTDLQIQIGLLSGLWKGVHRISNNKVYTLLSDLMTHKFQGKTEDIQRTLATLHLKGWEWFQLALLEGHNLSTLAQQGPNEVELDSFRLIWIMFHLGLLNAEEPTEIFAKIEAAEPLERNVERQHQILQEQEREERKRRAQERKERRARAEQIEELSLSLQIEKDHKTRIGSDFYTFLEMPVDASYKQLEVQVRKLTASWKQWLKKSLSDEDRELVRELLMAVQVVYAVLIDPERRPLYDQELKAGQPTLLKNPKALYLVEKRRKNTPKEASSEQRTQPQSEKKTSAEEMRKERIALLLQRSDFEKAIPLLQMARQEAPSDPDILAQLGWAFWQFKKDPEQSTEYLKLALTFNGKHKDALEWLGRILVDQKDYEQALRILKHLTKIYPQHRWAVQTMQKLQKDEEEQSNKSWFNRK